MRVGFTGTSLGMAPPQREALAALLLELGASEVHHGDGVGADAELHAIARGLGLVVVLHPPTDPKKRAFCRAERVEPERPYLDRNRDIVDASTLLIAAPGEQAGERLRSGTWATVRYAQKRGRRILVVRPDGRREERPPRG